MQNNSNGMFERRIGRLGFFLGIIYLAVIGFIVVIAELINHGITEPGVRAGINILSLIILVLVSIIAIPVVASLLVRRLHDLNQSGFWAFLYLVPFVGTLLALYLLFAPGNNQKNKYGKQVKTLNLWVILGLKKP